MSRRKNMRRLTAIIEARNSSERTHVHQERRRIALRLDRKKAVELLQEKAIDAAGRPSGRPEVTLTPEQAIRIADLLEDR